MRRFILASAAILISILASHAQDKAKTVNIGVTAIVEHPALDAIRDGTKAALEERGFIDGKNMRFNYQSAQNRLPTAVQIANKFVGDKVDVLVAIGTPSAQAAKNATHSIPILFSGITDPVAAGLIRDMEKPEANITGVSDLAPIADHIKLIKQLLPNVKKIGYLYNPSETNSQAALKVLNQVASQEGVEIVPSTAVQTAQVRNATLSIIDRVDVIYITTDNTIVSALESAVFVANENKKPLIVVEPSAVKRGALIGLGVDYFDIGKRTGYMAADILNGKKVGDIAVEVAPSNQMNLNEKTAKRIGYEFPAAIIEQATSIIK